MSPALNRHLKPDSDAVVAIAKKEGRWPPPHRCEACNTTKGRIVWHHHDYAHPVDVIALCRSCHSKVHAGSISEPRTGRTYPRLPPSRRKPAIRRARTPRPTSQIKAWRDGCGLKQKWVAEQLGVNVRTLQSWESGRTEPSTKHLTELMDIYRVPESEWPAAMRASA
jgi:DNA-binding XRE family transcriptional regulator